MPWPSCSVFHYVAGYAWPEAAVQAVTLAAVATLSSPAAVGAVTRKAAQPSSLLPVLQLTARIDALVAVAAFGLILAIFHQGQVAPSVRPPTATGSFSSAALATTVADRLPGIGVTMQTLTVGGIALNQATGPVLFRRGLERAGEVVVP